MHITIKFMIDKDTSQNIEKWLCWINKGKVGPINYDMFCPANLSYYGRAALHLCIKEFALGLSEYKRFNTA